MIAELYTQKNFAALAALLLRRWGSEKASWRALSLASESDDPACYIHCLLREVMSQSDKGGNNG